MSNSTILIQEDFYLISSICITTIGISGNGLVLFILTRPLFHKESLFRYLIIATIADTINVLFVWPDYFPEWFLIKKLNISCKVFHYLINIPFQFSAWVLVLSSIDRYLAVLNSKKFNFRLKLKFQIFASLILFATIACVNLPIFFYSDVKYNNCGHINYSIAFLVDLFGLLMAVVIPFILMILSTFLILKKLLASKKNLRKKGFEKEKNLIKTLIAMYSLFFICNLPYLVFIVIGDALKSNVFDSFIYNLTNVLTFVYFSCDFFLYFIFNKMFRKYCFSLLGFIRRQQDMNSTNRIDMHTIRHGSYF